MRIDTLERRVLFNAGDLDPTFDDDGRNIDPERVDGSNSAEYASDIVALPDGGYYMSVIGTRRDRYDPAERRQVIEPGFGVTYVGPDGGMSSSITSLEGPFVSVASLVRRNDGELILVGQKYGEQNNSSFILVRYARGEFSEPVVTELAPFAEPGAAFTRETAADSLLLPDGKLLVTGTFEVAVADGRTYRDVSVRPVVMRYNTDLTLDRTFGGGDGIAILDNSPFREGVGLAVAAGGDIFVATAAAGRFGQGTPASTDFGLARLNADGSADLSFGRGTGAVTTQPSGGYNVPAAIAVTPGGKVLVAGTAAGDFGIVRFNPDGTFDFSFGGGDAIVRTDFDSRSGDAEGLDFGTDLAVLPDGRFYVGGTTGPAMTPGNPFYVTNADFAVARYNPDGRLDIGFGGDGKSTANFGTDFNDDYADDYATALAIAADGKVVLGGRSEGDPYGVAAARFLGDPEPAEQAYQGEFALLSGPTARRDNAGYNGTGYADFTNASGDFVQWDTMATTEASHRLTFRYANGGADRPLELRVNGTVVRRVSFPSTGSWSKWSTVSVDVPLQDGSNAVRLTSVGSNGPNIDQVSLRRSPAPAPPPPPRERFYEAESAAIVGAEVHRAYAGYSGSGYVDYVHTSGDSVEWTITADAAQTHTLAFRYALGSALTDRPLELRVNGQVVQSRLSFPGTGSWGTWNTVTVKVPLRAGSNTVRLTTAGSNGPNVDLLTVTPPADAPPPQTLQAEDARLVGPGVRASNAGYTGGGYADFGDAAGQTVEWTAEIGETRDYVLQFRYANGGGSNRPLNVKVDGATPAGVSNPLAFAPTGSWTAWRTVSVTVRLTAGQHRIRLESVGVGPNVDALTIRPA